MGGHERPPNETVTCVIILWPSGEHHRSRSHRRGEKHGGITSSRRVQRDHRLHVLDEVHLGGGARASVRVDRQEQRLVAHDLEVRGAVVVHDARLAVVPGWHADPFRGQRGHCAGIQNAEAEQMVELETYAVHTPSLDRETGLERGPNDLPGALTIGSDFWHRIRSFAWM